MNDRATTGQGRPTGRKLAEWVTLCASTLLVACAAGYLVYDATRPQRPEVPVEVRVLTDQAQRAGELHIVPIEVRNRGGRTLSNLTVLVKWQPRGGGGGGDGGGAPEQQDITIDYLGEGVTRKAYLYFEQSPHELHITAQPFAYQLQ